MTHTLLLSKEKLEKHLLLKKKINKQKKRKEKNPYSFTGLSIHTFFRLLSIYRNKIRTTPKDTLQMLHITRLK